MVAGVKFFHKWQTHSDFWHAAMILQWDGIVSTDFEQPRYDVSNTGKLSKEELKVWNLDIVIDPAARFPVDYLRLIYKDMWHVEILVDICIMTPAWRNRHCCEMLWVMDCTRLTWQTWMVALKYRIVKLIGWWRTEVWSCVILVSPAVVSCVDLALESLSEAGNSGGCQLKPFRGAGVLWGGWYYGRWRA